MRGQSPVLPVQGAPLLALPHTQRVAPGNLHASRGDGSLATHCLSLLAGPSCASTGQEFSVHHALTSTTLHRAWGRQWAAWWLARQPSSPRCTVIARCWGAACARLAFWLLLVSSPGAPLLGVWCTSCNPSSAGQLSAALYWLLADAKACGARRPAVPAPDEQAPARGPRQCQDPGRGHCPAPVGGSPCVGDACVELLCQTCLHPAASRALSMHTHLTVLCC